MLRWLSTTTKSRVEALLGIFRFCSLANSSSMCFARKTEIYPKIALNAICGISHPFRCNF